jgi:hypothetical protein
MSAKPNSTERKINTDELVRFQVEIKPSLLAEIELLQQLCGLSSKKEVFNNAVTLLRWAALQKRNGFLIASINKDGEIHRELQLPCLEQAAMETDYQLKLVKGETNMAHKAFV